MRKDFTSLTRDLQGAMYLFMPLVFPFVIFLPAAQGFQSMTGINLYMFLLIFLMMLTVMTASMLVAGLLGMEESGASIAASLPIIPRDLVKAKVRIICMIQLLSSLIPIILLVLIPALQALVPFLLAYCLVSVTVVLLLFALKIMLFGKLHYKYVLEEVNTQGKALKWVAIIVVGCAFIGSLLVPIVLLGNLLTPLEIAMLVALIGGIGLIITLVVLHKMFPDIRGRMKSPELSMNFRE